MSKQPRTTTDAEIGCPRCGSDTCEDPTHLHTGLIGYTLPELAGLTFPPRLPLLYRGDRSVFHASWLAEVVAATGVGKTWFMQTLALLIAAGHAEAMGFRTEAPRRVLYIDGEMEATEVKTRFLQLADMLGVFPADRLVVVAADWQQDGVPRLDTSKGQTLIEPFVAPADAVFADNRSCLFDPAGEKDPVAWEPALRWLLALRRRGKGVMMGHHTARHGGARGHSKPEDPLNLILTLTRPADWAPTDGARFDIAFAKSRGIHDAAIVPFRVRLTGSGWVVMPGAGIGSKLLEHVQVNWDAGEPVTSANKAVTAVKVNRQAGLKTWGELLKEGRLEKVPKKGFRVC